MRDSSDLSPDRAAASNANISWSGRSGPCLTFHGGLRRTSKQTSHKNQAVERKEKKKGKKEFKILSSVKQIKSNWMLPSSSFFCGCSFLLHTDLSHACGQTPKNPKDYQVTPCVCVLYTVHIIYITRVQRMRHMRTVPQSLHLCLPAQQSTHVVGSGGRGERLHHRRERGPRGEPLVDRQHRPQNHRVSGYSHDDEDFHRS